MANVHVFCFFACYVLALALEGVHLWRRSSMVRVLGLAFGFAGLVAQSLYLVQRSNQVDLPPLLSSNHDWLLVLAWTAVVFYLTLSTFEWNLPLGLFLLPVVLILIGASDLVAAAPSPALAQARWAGDPMQAALRGWSMLHAAFLVFGIGGVIVGFIFSLMYLVQHRKLKHAQTAPEGLTLPSLATLARLNWWFVVVSIPLLTLGMLTGVRLVFLSRDTAGPIAFNDPLVIGSGVVWLVMILFFGWLLRANHVGGKQIALRTIWAFGFLLVTLIGLQVLTGGHSHPRSEARQSGRLESPPAPAVSARAAGAAVLASISMSQAAPP
jgi:hypothetical protein